MMGNIDTIRMKCYLGNGTGIRPKRFTCFRGSRVGYTDECIEAYDEFRQVALNVLKDYEDTGLTSNEITALQENFNELADGLFTAHKAKEYSTQLAALQAENAELKARLDKTVELPVPLGTQLYQPYSGEIIEYDLGYIIRDINGETTLGLLQADDHDFSDEIPADCIGSKLFLSREEAESALKGIEGNRDE